MKKKRHIILVVDDSEEIRWALTQTLRQAHYEVLEAKSGNDAFKLLGFHAVDLILSDIQMADGDGFSLLEQIRRDLIAPTPLAFISGHSEINPAEVKARGALTLFRKPFEASHLLEWIRAYLATQKR